MYDGYHWMLFFHVLAAVVWVGGGALTQVYAFRASRTNDPNRLARLMQDAGWVGGHVFMPSAVVLVALGFGLVADGPSSMGDAWVSFSLAVWALSAVLGGAFLGPEGARIERIVNEQGAASAEAGRRFHRILVVTRIELALLVLAVFAMVMKPG
ncbi:MAG: DUF2269 family protein [Gaiellales bacterium]